ncbi:hypothetical protein BLA24_27985 [Streptomyces cinnamoneus]|uniref:CBM6 domain-containing protein n=1 Tax=Streptomyces cinnamoneus TaxID=53446 RepID=A0A2G1XCL1_STRCJ|nr:carbohydrate-binding protein [Streptomyces cinnamoneus]PHQ48899.1 hypothetical protein BLA24_27985 [Streptomyces cinnamoneus]PPT14452.1 carbohydrate-binding protein [Streptomyces cinnamoneus]
MTAGTNGTGTPENDDPFGYLYRSEGGDGATEGGQAVRQPGVPRTSYNQVRPVGSRQYGQQPAANRAQQHPHYAAPETLPGGMQAQPGHAAPAQGGHGSRPNRRGLLIAAIAVVAVVATGIGVAMMTNNSSDKGTTQNIADGEKSGGQGDADKSDDSSKKKDDKDKGDKPKSNSTNAQLKRDASTLRLSGGATTEKIVNGAQATDGLYITGMNQVGAAVEWTVDVDAGGDYRLNARYGVPGKDANLTISTNGKGDTRPISMKNFGGTKEGDWEAGWKNTWSIIKLNKGTNTIKVSCEPGNACEVHLDQLWLTKGGA